jgi:uncharacterized repeat protein (TIGR01451 family)
MKMNFTTRKEKKNGRNRLLILLAIGLFAFNFALKAEKVNNARLAIAPPPTSCGAPISFALSNITTEGCDLNFLPSDTTINISYDYEIQPRDSAQGSASMILSGNTGDIDSVFTITGLNAATFYSVYVRAVCETNIASGWLEPLDLYTLPTCGSLWYDSGGPNGGALMNANEVVSICPGDSNQVVSVVFTSFDIQEYSDFFFIYDGPDTSFPTLFSNQSNIYAGFFGGGISGSVIPNHGFPIYSNQESGCLTFQFISDNFIQSPGWSVQLNCLEQPFCGSIYDTEVMSYDAHSASIDATASIHGEIQDIIWEAQPKGIGQGTPGAITGLSDSIPILLSGLAESTEYSVYFQVLCTNGDSSTWSVGPDFSTAPDCATAIDIQFGQVYSVNLDGWGSWNQGPSGAGAGPFNTLGQERLFRLEIPIVGVYIFQGLGGDGWVDYFWKDANAFSDCNEQNWNYLNDIFSNESFAVTLLAGTYYLLLDPENTQFLSQNFSVSYGYPPPDLGDYCSLAIEMNCPVSVEHHCMVNGRQWFYYEAQFDTECVVAMDYDDPTLNYFGQTISIYDGYCNSNDLIAQSVQSSDTAFDVLTSFSAIAGHHYLIKASNINSNLQRCFAMSFYCSDACSDSTACNYNPDALNGIGYCLYDAECNDCTNPDANNYNYFATIDDGTCVFGLQAKVFCDSNMDGLYSSPEPAAHDIGVYFSELDTILFTNANGIIDLDLPEGIYNLQLQLDSNIETSTPRNLILDILSEQLVYFGINSGCTIGCRDSLACNFDPLALYDNENCLFGTDCQDCIDQLADNYNPYATIDNGGCIYTGKIKVYCDLNGNGVFNTNEPGMPNFGIYFPSLNMTIFTDGQGEIHQVLEPGTYSVQLILNSGFLNTTALNANLIIPSSNVKYFGVMPEGNANYSLNITQNIQTNFHCTDGYYAGACIYYYSALPLHGYMTVTCDPILTPEYFYQGVPPDSVNAGYAEWNIDPFSNSIFAPRFHVDGPGVNYIGQTFNFDFHLVLYNDNDDIVYADEWTLSPTITCAYDPNIIEVDPIGYADPHYVASGEHLQYKVQFQNTGNAPASDVHIEDFLDPLVYDLSTFAPVVSSHNMNTCLHGDGSVDFVFNNINLPDSASNEQGSHGFLIYNVDLLDILEHNVVASNYADIYFEENPAVTTNTVINTVFDCSSISGITGPNSFCENDEVAFTAEQDFIESYYWQYNNNMISVASSIDGIALVTGSYDIEVILTNPICEVTKDIFVEVGPLPFLSAGADVFACAGQSITLEAESNAEITWSNGITNGQTFTPTESETLIVTSTNSFGCTSMDSINIEIISLPGIEITQSGVQLTAPEGNNWQWYFNGQILSGQTNQVFNATVSGVYYAITTNDNGCSSTSESITIVGVENNSSSLGAIYPNPMRQSAIIQLPEGSFELTLYDATGKLVKNYGKQQNQFILERSGLPPGKYQLILNGSNQILSVPIILE